MATVIARGNLADRLAPLKGAPLPIAPSIQYGTTMPRRTSGEQQYPHSWSFHLQSKQQEVQLSVV